MGVLAFRWRSFGGVDYECPHKIGLQRWAIRVLRELRMNSMILWLCREKLEAVELRSLSRTEFKVLFLKTPTPQVSAPCQLPLHTAVRYA